MNGGIETSTMPLLLYSSGTGAVIGEVPNDGRAAIE